MKVKHCYIGMLAGVLALAAAVCPAAMRPCNYNGADTGGKLVDDLAVYWPESGNWFIKSLSGEIIVNGTVSSLTPPATAVLNGLDTRQFNITFTSYNAFNGTFFNRGATCAASGVK